MSSPHVRQVEQHGAGAAAAAGHAPSPSLVETLQSTRAESGRTLLELVDEQPVLMVFLRHFGCTFCRQAMDDVAGVKDGLTARGVRPVFVHVGTPERAKPYFDYFGLSDVERVSDPDAQLYRSPGFQLARTHPLSHFLLWRVWKGWLSGALFKHGFGLMFREDTHQMPGVFVLKERQVVSGLRLKRISDRPDYLGMVDTALRAGS